MTDKPKKPARVLTKADVDTIPSDVQQKIYARAKKLVDDERAKELEDALYDKFVENERRKGQPAEDMVHVTIDLAPTGSAKGCFLLLDGVRYDHGRTVRVSRKVADVMHEQMERGWKHVAEIEGKQNENEYRREKLRKINASTLAVS